MNAMLRVAAVGMLATLMACAPRNDDTAASDTLTVDTVKPAATPMPDPVGAGSTTSAVSGTGSGDGTSSKSGATKAGGTRSGSARPGGSQAKQGTTGGELGRDSVIRHDTKDPRRTLPTVDTTKKPPR